MILDVRKILGGRKRLPAGLLSSLAEEFLVRLLLEESGQQQQEESRRVAVAHRPQMRTLRRLLFSEPLEVTVMPLLTKRVEVEKPARQVIDKLRKTVDVEVLLRELRGEKELEQIYPELEALVRSVLYEYAKFVQGEQVDRQFLIDVMTKLFSMYSSLMYASISDNVKKKVLTLIDRVAGLIEEMLEGGKT